MAELRASLSEAELAEWMAFDAIQPIGVTGEYWRAGLVASMILNVNRDPKKPGKAFAPEDFIPGHKKGRDARPPKLTPKTLKDAFAASFGGPRKG